jgi:Helix-turn-helix domain
MPPGRIAHLTKTFRLSEAEQAALTNLARMTSLPAGLVRRARIILALASGATLTSITKSLGITPRGIRKWAARYQEAGVDGLRDKVGRGQYPRKAKP